MSPEPAPPTFSPRRLRLIGLAALALAGGVVTVGIANRHMADARLGKWTEANSVPTVAVMLPDTSGRRSSLDLPGRLEANAQAQIYARVSGYLRELKADIGTRVTPGQVLAEIDAPDLDQQIMQAKADVASAKASESLARVNLERGQALISSGAVSKRDLDQRAAEFDSRQALVKSSQANVERLLVLEGYKRIVAPFTGIVTVRATDVGALINAGSVGGPALFVVSDVSRLKVYVNVPQNYVPAILIGTKAEIVVPEYPDRTFNGTVAASAQSVDVASGTTRMQISVDNHEGVLMTGAYASVRLELPQPEVSITVPASALIFDQNGMRVATVGAEDRVTLKTITISRDLGRDIEVGTGLAADDRIIVSPPDGVLNGDKVLVIDRTRATSGTADNKPRGKPPG